MGAEQSGVGQLHEKVIMVGSTEGVGGRNFENQSRIDL